MHPENISEIKAKNLLCVETSIPKVLVIRRCSFDCQPKSRGVQTVQRWQREIWNSLELGFRHPLN